MTPAADPVERIACWAFCLGCAASWMAGAALTGAGFWTIVASGVLGFAAGFFVTRFWR